MATDVIAVNLDVVEETLQEALDSLEMIAYLVRGTQNVTLITQVMGHVFNVGTMIKDVANDLELDVDVRTPVD